MDYIIIIVFMLKLFGFLFLFGLIKVIDIRFVFRGVDNFLEICVIYCELWFRYKLEIGVVYSIL